MPVGRSLVVSLHDAHPGSRARIEDQLAFLAGLGIARASILVVPEFHHAAPVERDGAFCAAATAWQAAGHDLVLHGFHHDRLESPPETLGTLFWTRLYTSREAEFLDLPPEAAQARLERGLALFAAQGWRARGFIAPAWLMAPGLPALLGRLGFAYTTTVNGLLALAGGEAAAVRAISSRSLCYSTRAAWRRAVSLGWNRGLYARRRGGALLRVSLHPPDLEFPALRRQIESLLRDALRRGFVPTTYADHVAG